MNREIIESNQLIARYVGGKFQDETTIPLNDLQVWVPFYGICRFDTIGIGYGKILKYHKSWDWLMPVIDKILSSEERREYESVITIYPKSIEKTYNEVVNFIKWYNK